jgi:hypothetical protein
MKPFDNLIYSLYRFEDKILAPLDWNRLLMAHQPNNIIGNTPAPKPLGHINTLGQAMAKAAAKSAAGYPSTQISNAYAFQLAAQNGWDVVVPLDDELQLDFDDDASYTRFTNIRASFETNIFPIKSCHVGYSKSGDPTKRHAYVVLDTGGAPINRLDRITYQLMLQSDPIREMLSWSRAHALEPYPALFFELPGTALGGKVITAGGSGATGGIGGSGGVVAITGGGFSGHAGSHGVVGGIAAIAGDNGGSISLSKDSDIYKDSIDDPSRYPHICPKCGGPAYIGLCNTDCKAGCK